MTPRPPLPRAAGAPGVDDTALLGHLRWAMARAEPVPPAAIWAAEDGRRWLRTLAEIRGLETTDGVPSPHEHVVLPRPLGRYHGGTATPRPGTSRRRSTAPSAGARLFTARVQYAYARLLLSSPVCAPERAAELVDEALLAARELGMGRLARRISELKP